MQKAAGILNLFGYLCVLFAVLGGILGIFDYQLVISGSELGTMDLTTACIIGGLGAVVLLIGYFWNKQIQKKLQKQQEQKPL